MTYLRLIGTLAGVLVGALGLAIGADAQLDPAPEWTFIPWGVFRRGYAVNRQVIRQAAFVRNLKVEVISRAFYVISNGLREIGFWNTMPETTAAAARSVATSKPLAKVALERSGLQVPAGKVFSRDLLAAAWRFAKSIGLPVVVKPTTRSGGLGVTSDIRTEDQFRLAWESARKAAVNRSILVEKHACGNDCRLYVIGDRVVAATHRIPAYIDGDGRSSISDLVGKKNQARRSNPFVGGKPMKLTPVMIHNLREMGLAPDSVLETGRRVTLHAISNMGAGGESADVTTSVHPDFQEIAVRARKALPGAIHAGVDLLADDISSPAAGQEWAICEINTNPDIALHHFPVWGTPRDVAGALIEYLFPGSRRCEPREQRRVRVVISGTVTGIGFRAWIWRRANLRGLAGWVRNQGAQSVEAVFCGAPDAVESMLQLCRSGPPKARVVDVAVEPWTEVTTGNFEVSDSIV